LGRRRCFEMSISVIIPTHNRLAFLQEAIASVQKQTLLPLELIIVDDGSTDGTWEWLQGVPAVKIFHQTQQGPGPARNHGVRQARGGYIAFLDSDDLWQPEKLATQIQFLKTNPEYQFCQTEEVWLRNSVRVNPKKKHVKPSGWVFADCLKLCLISPSAVMMKKAFFESLGGFDPDFPVCEDYELWLRAGLRSPFRTLPQAFTIKRGGHEDQLSKQHWGMDRFRVQAMEKILQNEVLTPTQEKKLKEELGFKRSVLAKGFTKRYPQKQNPYLGIS